MKRIKDLFVKTADATKKGKPPVTRLISKNGELYDVVFDENGKRRSKEEFEQRLEEYQSRGKK